MNRCSGTVAVLALTGFLLVACLGPGVPDPENEGLMASLPIYPGATLVQRYMPSALPCPSSYLWHVYAASDDRQAVRAFYKQNLADLGWQQFDPPEGEDAPPGRFYKDSAEVDVLFWDHGVPPSPPIGQVAEPPPGTAVFFGIVACLDPGVPDPENEGLMASLPIYPGATLVQKYWMNFLPAPSSYLWHVYATSDDGQAVRTFYKQNLVDLGWEFDPGEGEGSLLGRFYGGSNAEVDVFVWDHEMPPAPPKGQVAKPPPGTAAFFAIRVSHWPGVRYW